MFTFTNSPLVVYTNLSPTTYGARIKQIDTITPHVTDGHISLENLGSSFAKRSRRASSNYGIDDEGNIGMFVEEKDASCCSSKQSNDQRAITIEVASDDEEPYAITNAAMEGLIKLCADICVRNNIPKLLWKADKSLIGKVDQQNISVHRWFAAKSCPGDYVYNRLGEIADEVNNLLPALPPVNSFPYRVKIAVNALNFRKGPGINHALVGVLYNGMVYTIVEEANGPGASKWGRLKSGAGWISLDHCVKVR